LALLRGSPEGSYSCEGALVVIVFNQIGGMDLVGQLPSIIVMGIAYPFDQILKLF
jgi:hypothetical protein